MTFLIIFRLIRQVEECPARWKSVRLKPPAIFVYTYIAGLKVFTMMWQKIPFFWNVMPCELLDSSWCFNIVVLSKLQELLTGTASHP
jgi:hypothetical protein